MSDLAERLYPFARRARIVIVGRPVLYRQRHHLHFLLVTTDLSATSLRELCGDYPELPIVQHYTSADLERFFGLRHTKVVGFRKSSLAVNIYRELKAYRLTAPEPPPSTEDAPAPTE
jgi:hypothetical protein